MLPRTNAPPITSMAGVATKVRIVAKVRPPAMVLDSCVHHCDDGAPTRISRSRILIVSWNTIGIRPRMVVNAVRTTGRNLTRPARNAAWPAL